jgi:hypothetical protein
MGDIICRKCGEPWDAYGVFHGDMTPEERRRFLRGEGCPICDFGRKIKKTKKEQEELTEEFLLSLLENLE